MIMKLTEEQQKEERRKALTIIKAENEMLEEAKESVRNNRKLDESEKQRKISQIDESIADNIQRAKLDFNATEEEINSMKYKQASPYFIERYKKRLEERGLTDDEVHKKNVDDNAKATVGIPTKKRRHTSRKKKDEYVQDIEKETQLMRQTYIGPDDGTDDGTEKHSEEMADGANDKQVNEEKPKDAVSVNDTYDFDFSSIPDYIQYDVIPLPSNGQCYKHKIGRIPVAYLTASDENIIASPNMYRDGKIIDVILERKILDKRIKPGELCHGDRDAIVLWLRATGYGTNFPITATNPDTSKKYDINFDLSELKYLDFDLKGDENGYFDYETENGVKIKYRILPFDTEEKIRKHSMKSSNFINAADAIRYTELLKRCMDGIKMNDEDRDSANDCIEDMKDIVNENVKGYEDEPQTDDSITRQMFEYTMSINGNTDRDYIKKYIENMRAKDSYAYRAYVLQHRPGVDFNITVNIPKSDGGGSFDTFLAIDNTIFLNL